AGLLHVVAADTDAVELRHSPTGVLENIGDNTDRRLGWVDVGVADHELLEDVVLNGPRQLLRLHSLFFRGNDVQGQDRQHGTVHGHRHGHAVERDALEQRAHVKDAVDGDAGHADVAGDAGVVGVVAAVRRQVEGNAQTHLSGGEVATIKGVGVLGGGEAGV